MPQLSPVLVLPFRVSVDSLICACIVCVIYRPRGTGDWEPVTLRSPCRAMASEFQSRLPPTPFSNLNSRHHSTLEKSAINTNIFLINLFHNHLVSIVLQTLAIVACLPALNPSHVLGTRRNLSSLSPSTFPLIPQRRTDGCFSNCGSTPQIVPPPFRIL